MAIVTPACQFIYVVKICIWVRIPGLLQVEKKGVAIVTPAYQFICHEKSYLGENTLLDTGRDKGELTLKFV